MQNVLLSPVVQRYRPVDLFILIKHIVQQYLTITTHNS